MARQAIAAARDNPDTLAMAGNAPAFLAGENDAALSAIDRAIALQSPIPPCRSTNAR